MGSDRWTTEQGPLCLLEEGAHVGCGRKGGCVDTRSHETHETKVPPGEIRVKHTLNRLHG